MYESLMKFSLKTHFKKMMTMMGNFCRCYWLDYVIYSLQHLVFCFKRKLKAGLNLNLCFIVLINVLKICYFEEEKGKSIMCLKF